MPVTGNVLSRADLLTSLNADIKNSPATLIRGDVMAQKVADLQVSSVNILTDYSATYSVIVRQGTTAIANIVIGPSTMLGRLATGAIVALSGSDVSALIGASMAGGISVAAATTGNITLSGIQTLDGVTTPATVLVWMQTDPKENGVYVPAAGAWTRATNSDSSAELTDQIVIPAAGTLYGGHVFGQTTDTPVITTDNIVYVDYGTTGGIFVTQAPSNTQVSGQIPFWTSTQRRLSKGWTNLFWDHPNKRLGIGTNAPSGRLHIKGAGATNATSDFIIANSTPVNTFHMRGDGSWHLGLGATVGFDFTSVVIGYLASATTRGIAIGDTATAGDFSTCIGYHSNASVGGIAIGSGPNANQLCAMAFGDFTNATAPGAIIIGGSNQGAVTNDVGGSLVFMLSSNVGSIVSAPSAFLYHTSNFVLHSRGAINNAMFPDTFPFDWTSRNVLTLHNAMTPSVATVTSVDDVGGTAFFVHGGSTFIQSMSGVKVTVTGSTNYTNGVFWAHWQNALRFSLHPTRLDALLITNGVAYTGATESATVTFSPLSPDSTHLIADSAQLFCLGGDLWAQNAGGEAGKVLFGDYKIYRALLSQSGAGAPTATVLENTLGEVPSFSYSGTGLYTLDIVASLFQASKTFVINNSVINFQDTTEVSFIQATRMGNTSIDLKTFKLTANGGGAATVPTVADGVLLSSEIQILVYP